jgi:hypothetical protein
MIDNRPEEGGRALAYIGSILFSIGLTIFASVRYGFRTLLKSVTNYWAADWPTCSGQITTCDVKTIYGRFLDYAVGSMGYSYQIDGNYYSGYFARQFWNEQRAWTFVDGWKDKSILVNYNRRKPSRSVLKNVDQTTALIDAPHSRYPKGRFGPVLASLWFLRNVSDLAERKLNEKAKSWPAVSTVVEYAEPMMVGDDENAHLGTDIHYAYSVDGYSYAGSYYFRAYSEDDAEDTASQWRNRRILVHYFPDNPSRSVLIPDEQDLTGAAAAS